MTNNQLNLCRLLLAHIRNGDYTHAGDVEAIDIVVNHLKALDIDCKNKTALDAGCGLGGTAFSMSEKLNCEVTGIDMDENAINYAKDKYPELNFATCNILDIDKMFANNSFDLIYLFNVLYAIKDKALALQSLSRIAKQNAVLVLFDYVSFSKKSLNLLDFAGNEMEPLVKDESLKGVLLSTGWSLRDEVDLSQKYIEWYSFIIERIKANQSDLIDKFTRGAYEKVIETFTFLLNELKIQELGGYIIYAEKS